MQLERKDKRPKGFRIQPWQRLQPPLGYIQSVSRVMDCNTSKYGKACASARIWLPGSPSRLNSAFLLTFSRKIFSCRCTTAAASERCVNAAVSIFTAKCSGAVGTWPSSSGATLYCACAVTADVDELVLCRGLPVRRPFHLTNAPTTVLVWSGVMD